MKAITIATIIDFSIILPFIFAVSGKHQIVPYYLLAAAVLAFVAIGFRWYKNLGFEDRFILAGHVSVLVMATVALFLSSSLSRENFAQSISLPDMAYLILFYVILIIIGVYTTFWTRAGFVGIIGDPQVVRKNSLIMLAITVAMMLGVIFLQDFLVVWWIITLILWRSCMKLRDNILYSQRKESGRL